MPRYSLRTLIIVMLLGGPVLAGMIWVGREVNWAAAGFLLLSAVIGGSIGATASALWLEVDKKEHAALDCDCVASEGIDDPMQLLNHRPTPYFHRRLGFFLLGSAMVLFGVLMAGDFICGQRKFQRCIQCRTLKVEQQFLGFSWVTYRPCQHTEWYGQQGSAAHAHVWVGCETPVTYQNVLGRNIGAASNLDNGVATILTPAEQTQVYEAIGNVAEADAVFARLAEYVRQRDKRGAVLAWELKNWVEHDEPRAPWSELKENMEAALSAAVK